MRTRFAELFGVEHPIAQGGMMCVGGAMIFRRWRHWCAASFKMPKKSFNAGSLK